MSVGPDTDRIYLRSGQCRTWPDRDGNQGCRPSGPPCPRSTPPANPDACPSAAVRGSSGAKVSGGPVGRLRGRRRENCRYATCTLVTWPNGAGRHGTSSNYIYQYIGSDGNSFTAGSSRIFIVEKANCVASTARATSSRSDGARLERRQGAGKGYALGRASGPVSRGASPWLSKDYSHGPRARNCWFRGDSPVSDSALRTVIGVPISSAGDSLIPPAPS